LQQNRPFWITNDLFDLKYNLKPHLLEKKYMAQIRDKDGKTEFCFYDRAIDLKIIATAKNYTIIKLGEVPQ